MGHLSSRATLIYQHASRDRDEAIASALVDPPDRLLSTLGTGGLPGERAENRTRSGQRFRQLLVTEHRISEGDARAHPA